eukprot:208263_1
MAVLLLCLILYLAKGEQTLYQPNKTLISINDTIKVKANGYLSTGYSVNFMIGSDYAFHFNPRMPKLVLDRKINGAWGPGFHLNCAPLSIRHNDPILLEFKYTATRWEVSYMNQRITKFDYDFTTTDSITDIAYAGMVNQLIYTVRDGQQTLYQSGASILINDSIKITADGYHDGTIWIVR